MKCVIWVFVYSHSADGLNFKWRKRTVHPAAEQRVTPSPLSGFSSRWWVLSLTSSVYPKIRNSNLRRPSSWLLQTIAVVLWWAAGGEINPLSQQSSTTSSELVKRRQQNHRLQATKTDPAWCCGETLIFPHCLISHTAGVYLALSCCCCCCTVYHFHPDSFRMTERLSRLSAGDEACHQLQERCQRRVIDCMQTLTYNPHRGQQYFWNRRHLVCISQRLNDSWVGNVAQTWRRLWWVYSYPGNSVQEPQTTWQLKMAASWGQPVPHVNIRRLLSVN